MTFSELAATEAYLEALRDRIADESGQFRQDDPASVLKTYLGSSIRVVD